MGDLRCWGDLRRGVTDPFQVGGVAAPRQKYGLSVIKEEAGCKLRNIDLHVVFILLWAVYFNCRDLLIFDIF